MASPETAKAAHLEGGDLLIVERFPGELDNLNIPQRRQIQCLIKRHALTWATAELLAPLVFGEVAR
jgi:hypothetical protein